MALSVLLDLRAGGVHDCLVGEIGFPVAREVWAGEVEVSTCREVRFAIKVDVLARGAED